MFSLFFFIGVWICLQRQWLYIACCSRYWGSANSGGPCGAASSFCRMLGTVAIVCASRPQHSVTFLLAAPVLFAVRKEQFQLGLSNFVPWLRRLVAGMSLEEARVRSEVSLCDICGGQSGTGRGLVARSLVFTFQYHAMPFLSQFWNYFYQQEKLAKSGNLPKKQCFFCNRETLDRKLLTTSSSTLQTTLPQLSNLC